MEDGWERAIRDDTARLSINELEVEKIDADGACLFRAFLDQIGRSQEEHEKLRNEICDFLEKKADEFAAFVEEPFHAYVDKMRQVAVWGGDVEIQALVQVYKVHIWIYQPSQKSTTEECPITKFPYMQATPETKVVQLSYHPNYHAGRHFNSVWCRGLPRTSPTEDAIRTKFEELKAVAEAEAERVRQEKEKERIEKAKPRGLAARPKLKGFFN